MILFAAALALFLVLWLAFFFAAPALRHAGAYVAHRFTRLSLRSRGAQRFLAYRDHYRDYLPLVLLLLSGVVAAGVAGDAFLDLAELLHASSPALESIDTAVHDWAVSMRSAGATHFFTILTVLGGPVALATLTVVVTAILIALKRYRWAAYLAITSLGGSVINMELKRTFARARPALAEMLRQASGYSFPSGHSMGSTVVFGALSYIAFRALPSWRSKAGALAGAVTLVLCVALSRVYLGAHWISDVAAGVSAGVLWVTMTTIVYEVVRRIRLLRKLKTEP